MNYMSKSMERTSREVHLKQQLYNHCRVFQKPIRVFSQLRQPRCASTSSKNHVNSPIAGGEFDISIGSCVDDNDNNFVTDQGSSVISVLGIRNTGKSVLLNTMFGLQFSVGIGRCMQGASIYKQARMTGLQSEMDEFRYSEYHV